MWVVPCFGTVCAGLAEAFSSPPASLVRLSFVALAFSGSGLFVREIARQRHLSLKSEAKLEAFVETGPAAMITVGQSGLIEWANRAAVELMAPREGHLPGTPVAAFLPELHHAVRWQDAPQLGAWMQCRGHRGLGGSFTAKVWFSTYIEGQSPKLAAVVAEVGEQQTGTVPAAVTGAVRAAETGSAPASTPGSVPATAPAAVASATLTAREKEVLRLLVDGLANKEIAAKMAISESAVKNAIQQLFSKTGVRTRGQLVRVALAQYREAV
jgi:DNA-binding CsgD family transcriptional regulator